MVSVEFTEEDRRRLDNGRFDYPEEPRIRRKMEVLWLTSQGLSRAEVARLAGVSTKTVRRYVKQYQRGGIKALEKSQYRGRESGLAAHAEKLKEHFEKNPPSTVKQAQAAIEKLTGIRREYSAVRAFLESLGMQRRKAGTVPGHVDEQKIEEQRKFLGETLNPRLDEAEAGIRQLFFTDASHFVQGAFLGYLWCCVRRFLRTPSGRKRFNVLGALDFATKKLVTVTNGTYINSESVCELLKMLAAQSVGVPISVVLDNARYQRCRLVQDLAASLGIELLFLPSYSPNLNLIERLWKFVKGECLNGKYYETFPAFQAAIEDCLRKIPTDHREAVESLITRNFQLFDKEAFLQI
jgi:transposase